MRAILTYHSIDDSGSPISCHPEAFARHVAWLASGRVRVTTLDELATLPDSTDAVALTFDDGYVNFRDIAAPLLLAHGFPVTLFVVAQRVGQRNVWDEIPGRQTPDLPLLDWPALGALQTQGIAIGGHGATHRRLPGLAPDELEDEVRGCADLIEAETSRRPSAFAYPYGAWDPDCAQVVARVFRWACTAEFQALTQASRSCALPRLDMYYFARTDHLDAWGTPSFNARLRMRHGLRRARGAMAAFTGGR